MPDIYVRVSQNKGYSFRGPNNKDYNILGSILGSSYFRKLPCATPLTWVSKPGKSKALYLDDLLT